MPQRTLAPASIEAFRDQLAERFNFVAEKIQVLRTGEELGVEPGFGLLDSSQQARPDYAAAPEAARPALAPRLALPAATSTPMPESAAP